LVTGYRQVTVLLFLDAVTVLQVVFGFSLARGFCQFANGNVSHSC